MEKIEEFEGEEIGNKFNYSFCKRQLNASVESESDMRDRVREAHLFVDERSGQWEDYWYQANKDKPRYTFDKTSPLINNIAGAIKRAEFGINLDPTNAASKDDAEKMAGIVRHIQDSSDAVLKSYNPTVKNVITAGLDFWMIRQDYADHDSFDQDLLIEKIHNSHDRAWLDCNNEQQDGSDARWGWVFYALTKDAYDDKYPEGSGQGVNLPDEYNNTFFETRDVIIIGEFYYLKETKRVLIQFDNGKVIEENEDNKKIIDELTEAGFVEKNRRERVKNTCWVRKFDGKEFLDDEEKTVFSYVPIVPEYGNYKIIDNKILYHGVVEKMLDPQRVLNYALSREVEEGALAPRKKLMLTEEQGKGNWPTLKTMNTNMEPVQTYTHVDGQMPPFETQGANINPGLRVISETMTGMMGDFAGQFAAGRGDEVKAQSGIAIDRLQDKSDTTNVDYVEGHEIAICQTARILIDAIPRVYKDREVRVLKDDGSFELVDFSEMVLDEETGKQVRVNDLTAGKFSVICSAGATFKTRQQETVAAITEVSALDPSIILEGGDILLNSIDAPGMSQLADRKRIQLFKAGLIPPEQWSEEEKLQMEQAQQQPQEPDAMMVAALAEQGKADAEMGKVQIEQSKLQLQFQKQQFEQQKTEFELMMKSQESQMAPVKALVDMLSTNAGTLKTLREASGADSFLSPTMVQTIESQAEAVAVNQDIVKFSVDPNTRKLVRAN